MIVIETDKDPIEHLQEILADTDISGKPKWIEFNFFNRNWNSSKYFDIDLIPHIDLTYDRQMSKGIKADDGTILWYGYNEFMISFCFLGFSAMIIFNKLTDKWEN